MTRNNVGMRTQSYLIAATLACSLFGANLAAKDHTVTEAFHVSTQGLDLSQPAGVQAFYARMKDAAWIVCARPRRVDLVPEDNPMKCAEKALGVAIRSVNLPALTQIYLANHTLQQAAAAGIDIPLQAAANGPR
jgi:UrcA family protein